jgi:hypothetical protein
VTRTAERAGLVEVVEGLGVTGIGGDQPRRAAGLFHGLPGLGELDLFDAFGRHEKATALPPSRDMKERLLMRVRIWQMISLSSPARHPATIPE